MTLEEIADHIIKRSQSMSRKFHFSITIDHPPPRVPWHWKYKNTVGVSFTDINQAKEWLMEAISSGYLVAVQFRKRSWGTLPLVEHGKYPIERT
jgi:hypothetical protein